jgi:hypothetical protein
MATMRRVRKPIYLQPTISVVSWPKRLDIFVVG